MSNTDAAPVWLFDSEALSLGDVVLERGPGKGGALIAKVTKGPYNHALIWVGGDFVEAMPEGVRVLSFARVPIRNPGNWLLLRPPPQYAGIARDAALEARSMTYKEYDTPGALRTVLGPRRAPIPTKRFCSQLVAEAYLRSGLDLLPGVRPEAVTPNKLLESPSLTSVPLPLRTSDVFQHGPYPAELLDRSAAYLSSPMYQEARIGRVLFRSVEAMTNAALTPALRKYQPGNLGEVLKLLVHLDRGAANAIADALLIGMLQTGYLQLLVPQMASIWSRVDDDQRWKKQISGWEETRQRHLGNARFYQEQDEIMQHQLWRKLHVMHLMNAEAFAGLIEKAS